MAMKKGLKVNKKLIIFLLIIVATAALGFYWVKGCLTTPSKPKDMNNYSFVVNQGESPTDIVNKLEAEGYTNNPKLLIAYIKLTNKEFYANEYILNYSKTPIEIINILANSTPNHIENAEDKLTIIEGDNIQSIAGKIAKITGNKEEDILKLWTDKSFIKELEKNYWFITDDVLAEDIRYPLEGYFTPATYDITVNKTIKEITYQLLNHSEKVFAEFKDEKYINNYSFHEVLTLASIIERETNNDVDKYLVSGVFDNRLQKNMPLQADITVLYALDNHKEQVTYKDLEVDSPYNTYKVDTLPPGPIASPSITSIDAAAHPKASDYYYYFNTQDTGKTIYSKTYDEHLKVSEENAWDFN